LIFEAGANRDASTGLEAMARRHAGVAFAETPTRRYADTAHWIAGVGCPDPF
jgi:hypothetical protein